MDRLIEFFEAEQNRLSMTRLLMFASFFPATYVLLNDPTETIFGIYLGTFAGAYTLGKFAEKKKEEDK